MAYGVGRATRAVVCVLAATALLAGCEWLQVGGNATGTRFTSWDGGTTPSNVATFHQAWSVTTGEQGFGDEALVTLQSVFTVAVEGSYTGSPDAVGVATARSPRTGEVQWRKEFALDDPFDRAKSVTVHDGVFVARIARRVLAFRVSDGSVAYDVDTGGTIVAAVADGDDVWISQDRSTAGRVERRRLSDGSLVAHVDRPGVAWTISLVDLPTSSGSRRVLAVTGPAQVWDGSTPPVDNSVVVGALSVVDGVAFQYAGDWGPTGHAGLRAVDAATGALRWEWKIDNPNNGGGQFIGAGNGVIALAVETIHPAGSQPQTTTTIFALRMSDGAVLWHVTHAFDVLPMQGVIAGDVLYAPHRDPGPIVGGTFVSAFDLHTGALLWTSNEHAGSVLSFANGALYASSGSTVQRYVR
jgi:hypothetical protein